MPSPPFFKYLCRDISGDRTSAELMQCVRSRVTQSLTSAAALPVLQDATPAILHDVPSAAAAGHCRVPEHLSPHNDTQYHLLLGCLWRTDRPTTVFSSRIIFMFLNAAKGSLAKKKWLVATVQAATWNTTEVHFIQGRKSSLFRAEVANKTHGFSVFSGGSWWSELCACTAMPHSQDVWRL